MSEGFKWDINCPTPVDYVLKLDYESATGIMSRVFSASKRRLKKKHGMEAGKFTPEDVPEFRVAPQFKRLINTWIKPHIKYVNGQVMRQGARIINHEVDDCVFRLNSEKKVWEVRVIVKGTWTRVQ